MIVEEITAYCAKCGKYRRHGVNEHAIAVCIECHTRRPADGSAPAGIPIPRVILTRRTGYGQSHRRLPA
jgi:hypothetical protein